LQAGGHGRDARFSRKVAWVDGAGGAAGRDAGGSCKDTGEFTACPCKFLQAQATRITYSMLPLSFAAT
jgi:hypothetical protein